MTQPAGVVEALRALADVKDEDADGICGPLGVVFDDYAGGHEADDWCHRPKGHDGPHLNREDWQPFAVRALAAAPAHSEPDAVAELQDSSADAEAVEAHTTRTPDTCSKCGAPGFRVVDHRGSGSVRFVRASEAERGAGLREALNKRELAKALHSLLPIDPGQWKVWVADDWGGGSDQYINSSEFAVRIAAALAASQPAEREEAGE